MHYILVIKIEMLDLFKTCTRSLNKTDIRKCKFKYEYNEALSEEAMSRYGKYSALFGPQLTIEASSNKRLTIMINPLEVNRNLSLTCKRYMMLPYVEKYRLYGGCYYARYMEYLLKEMKAWWNDRKQQRIFILDPEGRFNRHCRTAWSHGQSSRVGLFMEKLLSAKKTISNPAKHLDFLAKVQPTDTYLELDRSGIPSVRTKPAVFKYRKSSMEKHEIEKGIELESAKKIMSLFRRKLYKGSVIDPLDYMDIINSCRVLHSIQMACAEREVPF